MLTQIHITNLATIQKTQLDFKKGTTVITGETGAGKSILIDAIELALGSRLSSAMIRSGQEKAEVSLCFDISQLVEARAWLNNYDLDNSSGECIIRRTLHREGRSRSFINDMPMTLQPLREFSELLINIHGQHEHQALLEPNSQRNLLDRFAGHAHLVDKVRELAIEWQTLTQERKELKKLSNERSNREEFLRYQIQELNELSLSPEEFLALDLEHKQLTHSGDLLANITSALNYLTDNEENNALRLLYQALQSLESIQSVDPKIALWMESLNNSIIHISDAEDELKKYLQTIDLDPNRLQQVEARMTKLFDIARKHRVEPAELFHLQQKLMSELTQLEKNDERLAKLQVDIDSLEKHYHEVAHKLSQSRLKAAKKLADQITAIIHELALPHGEFHILFEMEDFSHPSPHGMEKVIFEIKTNAGQPLLPLAKIASGGELSRISLAIHLATAGQHTTPILIFDEVDAGIGGGTAEIVGKLLYRLGKSQQVLCITHSPQIAAQSDHHLRVEKVIENNSTFTQIKFLEKDEKINELARMLGGVEITKTTLTHAEEMLEKIITIPNQISRDPI